MTSSAPRFERVSPDELHAILAQNAELQELAVIGPSFGVASSDHWPSWLKSFPVVFWLQDFDPTLSSRISRLTRLTSLALLEAGLKDEDAARLAALSNLSSLLLCGNYIGDEGASSLATLAKLTSLDLRSNHIGDQGTTAIAQLTELRSLDLSTNNVGDRGAAALTALGQLASLYLADNNIGNRGAEAIGTLRQLSSLNLNRNYLSDGGVKALGALGKLRSLHLATNNIGDSGAAAVGGFAELSELDLSGNRIGKEAMHAIGNLSKLTALFLDGNKIGNDAASIIGTLHGLRILSLRNTAITDLGSFVALSRLESIDVSQTAVSDFSPLLSAFERGLGHVSFERCPLVRPPPEIVAQGREAVLNYFRELAAQDVDYLFEAKLLLVGEGGAGKTSLLRRLYQPQLGLPAEDETTRGIDIHRHEFRAVDGSPFRLNVWDFGGQQIYHATHQFFLTKNSLYVLVDDTRKDAKSVQDEGFKYWFEVIEALSDGSPLLIFQNEKGGRSKTIDQAGIKGRFANLKEVYSGDLVEPLATDQLRGAIEHFVQGLPHIGEAVPAHWVSVRRALEDRSQLVPFISQQEYFDIYAEYLPFDRDKALYLSHFLHDLGVFLHFQEDRALRGTVILQNRWATEAVFRVLDDEKVKRAWGRFTLADCDRIWATSEYADMHAQLLALMEKFELCYRLADLTPECWIAPQLLSPSAPADLEMGKRPGDLLLHYRYEFLPKGLVNRLMVRMHRFARRPDQAWASGVLFEHDDSRLLVRTAVTGNEITLRARGSERKALLSVIASDLDALNESFRGMRNKVHKWVPCCCEECMASETPELYEEKRLRRRKQDGKLKLECPASYAEVSVLQLLDGVDLAAVPEWARPTLSSDAPPGLRGHRTITIFLASSSELQPDRDAFDLYFRQYNDSLRATGRYLQIVRYEHYLDAMSTTRLQDEYNRAARSCDVLVNLFAGKAGRYTVEELRAAHESFKARGRPFIYTYFRETQVSSSTASREDLESLWRVEDELKLLGHFRTRYESSEHLKRHFRDQLETLIRDHGL